MVLKHRFNVRSSVGQKILLSYCSCRYRHLLVVSSISSIRIYRIVRRHQLQIHVQQQAVQISNDEHNLNTVQKTKSAINTFICFIFMILCYSPMFIFMLVYANFPSMRLQLKVWWILVNTVTFMNSSVNPLLYCWRTYELRTPILKILRNMFVKQTVENWSKLILKEEEEEEKEEENRGGRRGRRKRRRRRWWPSKAIVRF